MPCSPLIIETGCEKLDNIMSRDDQPKSDFPKEWQIDFGKIPHTSSMLENREIWGQISSGCPELSDDPSESPFTP